MAAVQPLVNIENRYLRSHKQKRHGLARRHNKLKLKTWKSGKRCCNVLDTVSRVSETNESASIISLNGVIKKEYWSKESKFLSPGSIRKIDEFFKKSPGETFTKRSPVEKSDNSTAEPREILYASTLSSSVDLVDSSFVSSIDSSTTEDIENILPSIEKHNGEEERSYITKHVDVDAEAAAETEEKPDPLTGCIRADIYEVERILAMKGSKENRQYLLKWVGWPFNESTWVKESDLKHMQLLLKKFEKQERLLAPFVTNHHAKLRRISDDCLPQFFSLMAWEDSINRKLMESGQAPLYIYNDVDDTCRRKTFEFILKNRLPATVDSFLSEIRRMGAILGCSCETSCFGRNNCCPQQYQSQLAYTKYKRLSSRFAQNRQLIIECNEACRCSKDCVNRIVQRGRRYAVAMVRTKTRGWALFTLEDIPANVFVAEYVGEVQSVEEAGSDYMYQFDLDATGEARYVIDAKWCGNESAFINHSCDPNLQAIGVQVEKIDPSIHRIALFSVRRIKKGEELTLNYFVNMSKESLKVQGEMIGDIKKRRCRCGTAKCMQYLPFIEVEHDDRIDNDDGGPF